MTDTNWEQIDPESFGDWQNSFNFSKRGMDVDNPCPICGEFDLHRWYFVGRPINQTIQGNRFVAQGELWEWCSSCGTFQHYSGLVPDWWECDLEVNPKELSFTPEAIEKARLRKIKSPDSTM